MEFAIGLYRQFPRESQAADSPTARHDQTTLLLILFLAGVSLKELQSFLAGWIHGWGGSFLAGQQSGKLAYKVVFFPSFRLANWPNCMMALQQTNQKTFLLASREEWC